MLSLLRSPEVALFALRPSVKLRPYRDCCVGIRAAEGVEVYPQGRCAKDMGPLFRRRAILSNPTDINLPAAWISTWWRSPIRGGPALSADAARSVRVYLLQSPDPYDRAFVILVIEHLGDRRFVARLSELSKDSASIADWDILPFGRTVGEAARHALDRLAGGHNDFGPELELAAWLRAAREKPR